MPWRRPRPRSRAGAAIYYQDPDGKPLYSLDAEEDAGWPRLRAVPAGADVSFDEPSSRAAEQAADAKTERKIKYYRNPMGLPDTSPVPKKDSMGMDYIPVYEGEDSDDGSVKLSPGKIQRTGAKSEPVVRRPIRSIVRAPGTVQEDERRISVVALRFEGFVESVANVTTGDHVHKGQVLMNVYSPALSQRRCRISLRHQCRRDRQGVEGRAAAGWRISRRRSRPSRNWNAHARFRSRFPGSRRRTAKSSSATQ